MPTLIINNGSSAIESATEAQAVENMAQFLADVGIADLVFRRLPIHDDGKGRYAFEIDHTDGVIVLMVGLPLAQVRFMDLPDQNIWKFPRLYVNGSSWLWCYAVNILRDAIDGEQE